MEGKNGHGVLRKVSFPLMKAPAVSLRTKWEIYFITQRTGAIFVTLNANPRECVGVSLCPGNESSLPVNIVLSNTRSFYEAFVPVIFSNLCPFSPVRATKIQAIPSPPRYSSLFIEFTEYRYYNFNEYQTRSKYNRRRGNSQPVPRQLPWIYVPAGRNDGTDKAFSPGYISRVIIQPIEPTSYGARSAPVAFDRSGQRSKKKKRMDAGQIVSTVDTGITG